MFPRNANAGIVKLVLARHERGHTDSQIAAGVFDTEGKLLSEKDVNAIISSHAFSKSLVDSPEN